MLNIATKKVINQTYLEWTETLSDYPAPTYAAQMNFFKDASNKFSITAEASGTDHLFKLDPTVEGYKQKSHGQYQIQLIVTKDGKDTFVDSGLVNILPNLAVDSDPRGPWTIRYEYLKTAYETLCMSPTSGINVDGNDITYEDRDKLLQHLLFAEEKMKLETGKVSAGPKVFKTRFL